MDDGCCRHRRSPATCSAGAVTGTWSTSLWSSAPNARACAASGAAPVLCCDLWFCVEPLPGGRSQRAWRAGAETACLPHVQQRLGAEWLTPWPVVSLGAEWRAPWPGATSCRGRRRPPCSGLRCRRPPCLDSDHSRSRSLGARDRLRARREYQLSPWRSRRPQRSSSLSWWPPRKSAGGGSWRSRGVLSPSMTP